jgi:hypothetical protein
MKIVTEVPRRSRQLEVTAEPDIAVKGTGASLAEMLRFPVVVDRTIGSAMS